MCVVRCVIWLLSGCFCNHKPANGMRISDWSSDVCSSDHGGVVVRRKLLTQVHRRGTGAANDIGPRAPGRPPPLEEAKYFVGRGAAVEGKSRLLRYAEAQEQVEQDS